MKQTIASVLMENLFYDIPEHSQASFTYLCEQHATEKHSFVEEIDGLTYSLYTFSDGSRISTGHGFASEVF